MADEATNTNRLAAGTAALAANSLGSWDGLDGDREGGEGENGLGEHD